MKFINDNNTDPAADLFYRKVSECGKVEIGVHPVIFGFRVRAGYTNDIMYNIDYCCGNSIKDVEAIYNMVLCTLISRNDNFFEGFPRQQIKPMYNDIDCLIKLVKLSWDELPKFETIKLPDLFTLKRQQMDYYLSKLTHFI